MATSTPQDGLDGTPRPDPSEVALRLSRVLLSEKPLSDVLTDVATVAKAAIPEVDDVSVTVIEGGRPRSVVFTSDLAVQLDERQYEAGYGPCLDAARTGSVVQVVDTSADTSYPEFSRTAVRAGVTRSLSVGMPATGATAGGLNLYCRSGQGFDEITVATADSVAAHAAVAVANAASYARAVEQVAQMRNAMASRSVIEQAKGILMALRDLDPDEAFAELSRMSGRTNRKVRAVAQELVDSRGRGL